MGQIHNDCCLDDHDEWCPHCEEKLEDCTCGQCPDCGENWADCDCEED